MSPLLHYLSQSEDSLIEAESRTKSEEAYREVNNCLYEARKWVEKAKSAARRMEP